MPSARIKLYDVMDVDTGKTGVISVNHRLIMHGDCIPITPGKPDEGIWLENRRKGEDVHGGDSEKRSHGGGVRIPRRGTPGKVFCRHRFALRQG